MNESDHLVTPGHAQEARPVERLGGRNADRVGPTIGRWPHRTGSGQPELRRERAWHQELLLPQPMATLQSLLCLAHIDRVQECCIASLIMSGGAITRQALRLDHEHMATKVVLSGGIIGMKPPCQRTISRIVPSNADRIANALGSETIERASRGFRADGALVIEDIVETAIIAEARRAFERAYSHYLDGSNPDDVLMVGDLRLLITIKLEPPFDDPYLFANPYLLPVLSAVLDDGFVLGAFGVVCSLPLAPAQQEHDDGGILFPRSGLDVLLPAAAITVGIPLLEMNEVHGTTALWLGSHREASNASKGEAIEPVVREGSCMLWDFRLKHGGTPNRSTLRRPLLYLTYCRPWFFEYRNYTGINSKKKPLLARQSFLSGLSEQHKRMLSRARED